MVRVMTEHSSRQGAATPSMRRVVIVGASLAGLRAAETLRTEGFAGDVTVLGAEPHRPYDRPPLSNKLLAGEWEAERVELRQPDVFDDLEVTWRFGTRATQLDLGQRHVVSAGGQAEPFDGLVLATGATCRRLPEQDRHRNAHVLRTIDDAFGLRSELLPGDRRVVVVGAGFIGLEVAATARRLGNDVTVLEGAEAPLMRGLGAEMGHAIGRLHVAEGVAVRTGVRIAEIVADGLVLADGSRVDADVLVVGIGVEPAVAWLQGSGLELRDGVVADEHLRARLVDGSLADRVLVAGDIARWTNPLFGEEMRIEHWTNAAEQGAAAAKNLLAVAAEETLHASAEVPFFWSDQFSHRIQFLGRAHPDDIVVVVAGSIEDGKWLALYGRGGLLRGALGVNAPRWVMPMRKHLIEQRSFDETIEVARTLA
jgi:NADPH-dependent 2,4-dienoyl-CoA reductase/sulfur reductase-like enzyme